MVTQRKLTGILVVLIWLALMAALCCRPAHGWQRFITGPVTAQRVSQQFDDAYRAMQRGKTFVVTSTLPTALDYYFQRAFADAGKSKTFIVTSNLSADLQDYFERLYTAINEGT